MQPRSRTRCRDPPPPPSGGGRHRRRSPPPPSPRHQRRPPPPQRRSPDRPPPRRYEEIPVPIPDSGAVDRRSRVDILLEAGRLAAHYLVAQGVIPDHVLRAREDPNHVTVSRPEPPAPPPPAPAGYGRKRDDEEEDPRWRRAGDWGRAKGDDDRQSRRSGWDRRSHSFDDRRKYDVDRGARRTRDYDEPNRPPMSRSYSHNDRRPSGDGRLDPKRRSRSRSRSRTRTRTYQYGGSRRDSDGRPTTRDLDHTKLPDSAINPAGGEMPRKTKVHSSVVVAEVNDSADQPRVTEDGQMELTMVGLDRVQDVSEEEDGEFAEDVSEEEDGEVAEDVSQEDGDPAENVSEEEDDGELAVAGEDGAEMDVTERQSSDGNVHQSESVEELQLSNVEEGMEDGATPVDASIVEPSADKVRFSEVRDEMEAPQSEVEAGVGDIDRDGQDLPTWYGIFDLNVVETPEGYGMPEISVDSPADCVCSSVPDLAGQMNQQTKYDSLETQDQDGHEGANHPLEDGHDLSKYDLNNITDEHAQDYNSNIQGQDEDVGDNHLLEDEHDFKCDLNHEVDAYAQDNHLLSNEEIHLNGGLTENGSDSCRLSNEQMLVKQNADELEDHDDHQMENGQMLVHQGTLEQGLDTYHLSDEQSALSPVTDEQVVHKHQLEPDPMHVPMHVHDVDSYNLNDEQMLLNNGTNKHAEEDACNFKDGETLLDQDVDRQGRAHDMGNGRTVDVIDPEGEQQLDTRDTREFLESISDKATSSFPENPHTNIQAVSSSSITPNFGTRCTGRGAVKSQVIPGDDDALYGAFDKMPSEAINVWDLPSSELGKSS